MKLYGCLKNIKWSKLQAYLLHKFLKCLDEKFPDIMDDTKL